MRGNDTSPSFNLFMNDKGRILYKDFGHSSGDSIKFVMEMEGLTYHEALNKVYNELILKNLVTPSTKIYKKENKEIRCRVKPFTYEIPYFKKYNITPEVVKRYNTKAISEVWVGDKLRWVSVEDNFIIGYYIPEHKEVKCYRPNSRGYISNFHSKTIFGYYQLPVAGDLLIWTKSPKDVLYLASRNYNSICFNAETCLIDHIDDNVIEDLKNRFTRHVVVYDNDAVGHEYSKYLSDALGCERWFTPSQKDITDYHEVNGLIKTEEILKTI